MTVSTWTEAGIEHERFWDELSEPYQRDTRISTTDFHYGPLLPGDRELKILPSPLAGSRCLELGAGAGQNSLFLAAQGAHCTALDISAAQLEFGRALAKNEKVPVDFIQADLDRLPLFPTKFDLIHSAYGIPFSSHPEALIQACSDLLTPGGHLLFSMGHPVFAGEWLELDEDQGIFLSSYFHPRPDVREGGDSVVQAMAYPLSECVRWIKAAGLELLDLREPSALPVHLMSNSEIAERVPYYSDDWADQENELTRFPVVAVFLARKP
ncbi:MAG: class I SAM-dependent methyltransferase [Opitutales bacterium]